MSLSHANRKLQALDFLFEAVCLLVDVNSDQAKQRMSFSLSFFLKKLIDQLGLFSIQNTDRDEILSRNQVCEEVDAS